MQFSIKLLLRPIYKNSKPIQFVLNKIRFYRYKKTANSYFEPFMKDSILTSTVIEFIIKLNIKLFIETGTYLGHTCRYLASKFPLLKIITIELNHDFFNISRQHLNKYTNVEQKLGNSAEQLEAILSQNSNHPCPIIFLDAHWYDYLPLPEEIRSIGIHLNKTIYILHDFQVPDRNDFGYDICNGRAINVDMLMENMVNKNSKIFVPKYTFNDVFKRPPNKQEHLRGYAIVIQNFSLEEYALLLPILSNYYKEI